MYTSCWWGVQGEKYERITHKYEEHKRWKTLEKKTSDSLFSSSITEIFNSTAILTACKDFESV